jgi:hypothetical protein
MQAELKATDIEDFWNAEMSLDSTEAESLVGGMSGRFD